MHHLALSIKTFLTLLNDKQVEYLLVGGYAVRYYGYQRETRDLDLWTARHPLNVAKIVEVLQAFVGEMPEQTTAALRHERRIFRITIPAIRMEILDPIIGRRPEVLQSFTSEQTNHIEILTIQSGLKFEDCFAERTVATLDGVGVNVISLRHLKIIKQEGGRPHDLDDLAHLP
jgi:predicted nucleotidyltransferase